VPSQPENLLLSDTSANPRVMISDFGLSKMVRPNQVMETACGTLGYAGALVRVRAYEAHAAR
jgi:serine/threonine protein kinase